MLMHSLAQFARLLRTRGFTNEATLLTPSLIRYADELSTSTAEPGRIKAKFTEAVKQGVSGASYRTPLGVVGRVLVNYVPDAGIYGWLEDPNSCFIAFSRPRHGVFGSKLFFFDLGNGQYVGIHNLRAEEQNIRALQQFARTLQEGMPLLDIQAVQKQFSAAKDKKVFKAKYDETIRTFKQRLSNAVNHSGIVDAVSTYASEHNLNSQDFDFPEGATLQELVDTTQLWRKTLPGIIKQQKQKTLWVPVTVTADADKKRIPLSERLAAVIAKHDDSSSPLAMIWNVLRPQEPRLKIQCVDLGKNRAGQGYAVLTFGGDRGQLTFSTEDGSLRGSEKTQSGPRYETDPEKRLEDEREQERRKDFGKNKRALRRRRLLKLKKEDPQRYKKVMRSLEHEKQQRRERNQQ